MPVEKKPFIETARHVLSDEINSLQRLEAALDVDFGRVCEAVMGCKGRVVFSGVGHSGHVGNKSAASMSSLCKPAYFLHAGEATHGDLGLVQADDVVILISNSGETGEVLQILPRLKALGVTTIAIVGKVDSTLARSCDIVLPIAAGEEAGPFKFAGSSSALNTMALCDALIMAVAAAQGLTAEAYLQGHPGGAIGKQIKDQIGSKIE
jgi:arabinose-5-phosphate isomerase